MKQESALIISSRHVGVGEPCFIIAEISGNHHQKYEEAEALVRAAKEAGADAVKLQTYTPHTITLNADNKYFRVQGKDQPDDWKGARLWDLYQEAHTPWEWQPRLKRLADELGLLFFSSVFDETSIDFLEREVGVEFYKIASYEAIHIPLLKRVAATGKAVIISIGFASEEEATLAVTTLRDGGAFGIGVLHCVTAYADAPDLDAMNLKTIADIAERFGVVSGFSDNNAGILVPTIAAVQAGAHIIEKHMILSRDAGGPDARFSLEPKEFAEMVQRIRLGEQKGVEAALRGIGTSADVMAVQGHVQYGPASPQEAENTIFRPSIWVKRDIQKGEILTTENIRVARPSYGLAPKYFDVVLGKRAARDIAFATPLSFELVEDAQPASL